MLAVVGLVRLALKHPDLPPSTRVLGENIGHQMLTRLMQKGLKSPKDVLDDYLEAFFS